MPVRIGAPSRVNELTDIVRNPIYSTAVRLLGYGTVHSRQAYGLGYNAAVEMIDEMSNAKHNQGDIIAAEVLQWAAKELRGENDA